MGYASECYTGSEYEHTFGEPTTTGFDGLGQPEDESADETLLNTIWFETYECEITRCDAQKTISWSFPVNQFTECCDNSELTALESPSITDYQGLESGPIVEFTCSSCGHTHTAKNAIKYVKEP